MSPFWHGFVDGLGGGYKPRLWGFINGVAVGVLFSWLFGGAWDGAT